MMKTGTLGAVSTICLFVMVVRLALFVYGPASIIGMGGIIAESPELGLGSILGGGLFLAALVPLSLTLLRRV